MTRNRIGLAIVGLVVATIVVNVLGIAALSVALLISPATLDAFRGTVLQRALGLVFVLLGLATGAFAAVRIAKVDADRVPLDLGIAYIGISVIVSVVRASAVSWPWLLGGLALVVPASLVGGRLARRRA